MDNEEEVVIFTTKKIDTVSVAEAKWDEFIDRLIEMQREAAFRHEGMTIARLSHWASREETLQQVIKIAKEMKEG